MTRSVLVVAMAVSVVACGRLTVNTTAPDPNSVDVAALWEPAEPGSRDLLDGPGGPERAPDTAAPFALVSADRSGYSPGYDVRDARGALWSVKLGPEAQSEVAASRLLWAIGYHQPPAYYVARWELIGGTVRGQAGARFRPELADWKAGGEWSWYDNEFLRTPAYRRFLVANVLLNNWDWKASNNRIYDVAGRRRYVVRDLGASLGKTAYPALLAWFPSQAVAQGSRNHIDDFEAQGFIRRATTERVEFDYDGIHDELLDIIRPEDVVRTSQLFAALPDSQLDAAFRSAGYGPEIRARYVAKIRSKVAEGLKLAP